MDNEIPEKCMECQKPITRETGVRVLSKGVERFIHFTHFQNPILEELKTRSRKVIPWNR